MSFKVCKKNFCILFFLIFCGGCITKKSNDEHIPDINPNNVYEKAELVLNWQLQHYKFAKWTTHWYSSTFFIGLIEFSKVVEHIKGVEKAYKWSEKHDWEIQRDILNADNLASGQVYLQLFEDTPEPKRIGKVKAVIDSLKKIGIRGRQLWSWSDALFMAPPTIAHLGKVTGEKKYFELLNSFFWDAKEYLYDKDYHLFYRDKRFFERTDKNANRIFWSRGNGWVAAGLVRVLQKIPESNAKYDEYMTLYKEMMDRIVILQPKDGLWRTNLLSPEIYPTPETSGTAFFCYALGWGVNNEILTEKKYKNALVKAWQGLTSKVASDGKLGSVQDVASSPGGVDPDNSELYATGAFLLAAKEMYIWSRNFQ